MQVTTLLEIFGGTGAVLLGLGGCIFNYLQKYNFNYNYKKMHRKPSEVLKNTWEHDTEMKQGYWKRLKFCKISDDNKGKWVSNIEKGQGNVFIYKDTDEIPDWDSNKGKHFLRINIKNIVEDVIVEFQQKYWTNDYNKECHDIKRTKITQDGEHYFISKSLIGTDDIKREQIGVFISGNKKSIKNLIIDEVYYGEKWWFFNIKCCGKKLKTILYREKEKLQ